MSPHEPLHDESKVTWDGVHKMIREYDQDTIVPREQMFFTDTNRKHADNLAKFTELWSALKEFKELVWKDLAELKSSVRLIADTITSWKGSLTTVTWLLAALGIPVFLMVLALFIDLLRWGALHGWKY